MLTIIGFSRLFAVSVGFRGKFVFLAPELFHVNGQQNVSVESYKYPEDEDRNFLRNLGTCPGVFHKECVILQQNVLVLNCIDEIRTRVVILILATLL